MAWSYKYVREYLHVRRRIAAELAKGRRVQVSWCSRDLDAAEWQRECIEALDRRINAKVGTPPRWRKLDADYQVELRRDAQRIHDKVQRRIALHQLATPELRRRFQHLLSEV